MLLLHGIAIAEETFEAMVQDALQVPALVWKEAFEGRLTEDLADFVRELTG